MTLKHTILKICSRLMPDLYSPPAGVLFPFGHIVTDNPPPHIKHIYRVPSTAKFRAAVDFLCRNYYPIRLSELEQIPHLRRRKASRRGFLLSFDDGMREVYDVIAPILREKGIPAIFFVNSATVDNRRVMWRHKVGLLIERLKEQSGRIPGQMRARLGSNPPARLRALRFADEGILDGLARDLDLDFDDYLRRARPYLTTDQILELSRSGFEFGAHSDTHPYFCEMAAEGQKKQISASVDFIRALGLPCRCFAFPFSDNGVPTTVFKYLADLGVILSFGTSEARVDSVEFSFQRFALDGANSRASLPDLLQQLSVKSLVRGLTRTEVIRRN